MNKKQLEEFIKHIKPKHVFPIHAENQHLFKEKCKNVQMVEYGKQYIL